MNKQFLNKLSSYALYVLFTVILVVLGLFYLGGEAVQPISPDMSQPEYTDALLYLTYGLSALAVIVAIGAFLFQFGSALKDNPINALKSLSGVLIMVIILIVSWFIGSDEKLVITGYEGSENVPFWLKLTDMFLYSTYFLLAITLGAMLFSGIKKKIL